MIFSPRKRKKPKLSGEFPYSFEGNPSKRYTFAYNKARLRIKIGTK